MHATDVIGYVGDGEILCEACGNDQEDHPIFADSEDLRIGETCGGCGAFYTPDESWSTPRETDDYRADLNRTRWAMCAKCNHQEPRWIDDARARLTARRGEMICPNCHGMMRF